MRKMTMPNFCINFLNKAAKLLPILYDFTVASLMDAWIKINTGREADVDWTVASLADAWIKTKVSKNKHESRPCRTPHGCVD